MISFHKRAFLLRWLMVLAAAHLIVTCQAEQDEPDERENPSPWGGSAGRQYRRESMGWRDYAFMVFRYALFIFIICFPFWRGIRVWYRAGGRVLWRRSERGWITGIRFQAPDLERWLILSGYTPEGSDAVNNPRGDGPRKLTADEVYELPEISYTKPEENETDIEQGAAAGDDELAVTHHGNDETSSSNNANNATTNDANDSNDVTNEPNDSTLSPDSESTPVSATTPSTGEDATNPTTESSSIEMVSQTPSAAATRAISQLYTTSTISTSCSICIEDFCEGEKVRLLPCGHAFHTECILPWLTERQGCCPCCKEPVIREETEDKENEDGENQQQNGNESNNNNNENASATGRSSYMLGSRNYHASFVGPW